ncbi:hypothetical protein L2D14_00750 [Thalassospiraceae bacterium LMO-JJ14]|nr:hypothetical protein L2D14_00750 [Thalassospiraceae bacterium LMO-JJ14]
MGLFGKIFGGDKKPSSDLPPEVRKIFDKMARVMEDEKLQNSMYPDQIKSQIENGQDTDEISYAVGEFGRTEDNPIPVNGPIGELVYLSCLKTKSNARLLFHRLGSMDGIDFYETVTIDGRDWDVLFFSMYHPRKSKKAPSGYVLTSTNEQPLLFGTNRRVENFPYSLQQAIRSTTSEIFGFPLPPPQVRQAEESVKFQRPKDHLQRVKSLVAQSQGYRRDS